MLLPIIMKNRYISSLAYAVQLLKITGKPNFVRKAIRMYCKAGVSPCMKAYTQLGKFRAHTTKANKNMPGAGESVFQTEEQRTLVVL